MPPRWFAVGSVLSSLIVAVLFVANTGVAMDPDFSATYRRLAEDGMRFVSPPRTEPYGQVADLLDVAGNRWDLCGPAGPAPRVPDIQDPELAAVLALEQELLRTECRADADRLGALLHPDFVEYGASGMSWARKQVIDRLTTAPELPAGAAGFRVCRLAEDVALVTFQLLGTRVSLRSSVWLRGADGHWRMRFHQGTTTDDA